jgi:hypothetical protein
MTCDKRRTQRDDHADLRPHIYDANGSIKLASSFGTCELLTRVDTRTFRNRSSGAGTNAPFPISPRSLAGRAAPSMRSKTVSKPNH